MQEQERRVAKDFAEIRRQRKEAEEKVAYEVRKIEDEKAAFMQAQRLFLEREKEFGHQ